jgi:putative oxidoreductase
MNKLKNIINNILYGNSITAVLRILMGLLFIYSGFFKILDLENFSRAISLYGIAPGLLVPYGAIVLPVMELVIGILLLFGYKIKASSLISIALMIFWTVIISINVYWGKNFECGCFETNKFGLKEEIGIPLILRDIVFLFILFLIFQARQYVFSIDKRIEEKNLSRL